MKKAIITLAVLALTSTLAQATTLVCQINDNAELQDPTEVSIANGPVKLYTANYTAGSNDLTVDYYVGVGMDHQTNASVIQFSAVNRENGRHVLLFGGVDYDAGIGIKCRYKK